MTLLKILACSLVGNSGVMLIPVEPPGCVKGPGLVPPNQPLYGSPPPPGGSFGGSPPPSSPGNRPPALVLKPVLGLMRGKGPCGNHAFELEAPPRLVPSFPQEKGFAAPVWRIYDMIRRIQHGLCNRTLTVLEVVW